MQDCLERKLLLGTSSTMSPGSGDAEVWPIEQQQEVFALFGDVRALIGVELTPSFLMVPNKSVSSIRFPTETDFRSCQVCHREDCPNRRAAFDGELWRSIQHELQPGEDGKRCGPAPGLKVRPDLRDHLFAGLRGREV